MAFRDLVKALGGTDRWMLRWVGGRTMQEAYAECPRAGCLAWFFLRMIGQPGWPTFEEIWMAANTALRALASTYPEHNAPMCVVLRAFLKIPKQGFLITPESLQAMRLGLESNHEMVAAECAAGRWQRATQVVPT